MPLSLYCFRENRGFANGTCPWISFLLSGIVAKVDECGPVASEAGLCVGDIILTINGNTADYERLPTGPVKMKIVRHNCECPDPQPARPHACPHPRTPTCAWPARLQSRTLLHRRVWRKLWRPQRWPQRKERWESLGGLRPYNVVAQEIVAFCTCHL